MTRRNHRAWLAVASGVGLVAAVIVLTTRGAYRGSAHDPGSVRAIRSAISDGLVAAQTAALPPPGARGERPTEAAIAAIRRGARASVARYYAGGALDERLAAVESSLSEAALGDVVYLDAGVDSIVIRNVDVAGNTATASGTAEVWLDVGQVQPGGSIAMAHPRNTMLLAFSLMLDGGTWKIVAQSQRFAPGSEP
jgi:hypothetical protein